MGNTMRTQTRTLLAGILAAITLTACSVSLDDVSDGETQDGNAAAWREAITALATQSLRCEETMLEIDSTSVIVTVTGRCEQLVVSGTSAVVVAEEVGTLEVSGTSAVVLVTSLDTLNVSGTSAQVYWSEGTPSVTDTAVDAAYGNPPAFKAGDLP